jgi:hypothetical protein
VLPDAPIVIVRAAALFIINLFIYLLFYWHRLQINFLNLFIAFLQPTQDT